VLNGTQEIDENVVRKMEMKSLKQKVSSGGVVHGTSTYSSDSVLCLEPMRSAVMFVCQMGRNASGWQDGGKGHSWNVLRNGNPVPSMGRYLYGVFQMNPEMRDMAAVGGSDVAKSVDHFQFGEGGQGDDGGCLRPRKGTRNGSKVMWIIITRTLFDMK